MGLMLLTATSFGTKKQAYLVSSCQKPHPGESSKGGPFKCLSKGTSQEESTPWWELRGAHEGNAVCPTGRMPGNGGKEETWKETKRSRHEKIFSQVHLMTMSIEHLL